MFKRSHAQIFLAFLSVHVLLMCIAGFAAWSLIDNGMRQEAQKSAQSVARVLTAGGFTLNDDVLQRMQDLTGYQFQILPADATVADDLVVVDIVNGSGERVGIYYQTERYHQHVSLVLWVTIAFVLIGVVIFIPVAWFIARRFARPLETLAQHAKLIGSGEWDQSIEVKGAQEIIGLSAALEQMRRQLNQLDVENRKAERLATVGTFTATIAHEVRNPLAAVKIMLQLIQKDGNDDRIRSILDEIERLDLMVDELLGFSAGMQVQLSACQLETVATEVKRLLQRQADHADVVINVTGSACVMADERRMRQLLLNLVLNAIQAQHGGGSITICINNTGCVVQDDGPGVPDDLLPDLFTAFNSRREQGTGLGLHMAQHIAHAHDAKLTYSRESGTTCFSLTGLKSAE